MKTALSLDEFLESINFSGRKEQFKIIAEALLELNRPLMIVETGCMRPPQEDGHEWEDGQATLVWDWLATETKGLAWSVDIDPVNVKYAKPRVSSNTVIICDDSIHWLSKHKSPTDLIYLDSLDYKTETEAESCLHACGELAAIWPSLNSGAIIAADDCIGPFRGKHALVRMFCEMFTGAMPVFLSNICAWRKP